jgi:DNA-binding beta-propeller fold protein YncE
MNSRRAASVLVAVLCFTSSSLPQVNGIQVAGGATAQVFGGKSPVVKVTDSDGKELASILIGARPGRYVYSESANTLYVVHSLKRYEHIVSAVNLTTNRVDKQIKVGAGDTEAVQLLVSGGGRRVFCYTACSVYSKKNLVARFKPVITAIDTTSNKVVATHDWLDSFVSTLPGKRKTWYFSSQLLAGGDEGALAITSEAFWRNPLSKKFVVFSENSSGPTLMSDTAGRVAASMFSKDEKRLFAATTGDKKSSGSLVVVDLEKATAVKHDLTDHPTRLFRLGSNQEPWVLGSGEMRSFSETGELGDRRIPLSQPAKGGSGGESGATAFLDGFPGETISLGNEHAAMLINNKNGGSRHKVALVDLNKLQIDAIIPTMSSAEIAGIRTRRYLAAFGMSMATAGALVFIPNMTIRNESLAARPDGRLLYALDVEGHAVTVVDVQTATVVRRIPVNHTIARLQVSSDGKHLICLGAKIQQINLETNDLEYSRN